MSSKSLRYAISAPLAAALLLPAAALAGTSGSYLTWSNKSSRPDDSPPATVQSSGQTYAVPPSPYGNVGDPFKRSLNWPSKASTPTEPPREVAPQSLATVQSLPPPENRPAPITVPVPPTPLEPARPSASITAPVPLPAPKPVTVPKEAVAHSVPKAAPPVRVPEEEMEADVPDVAVVPAPRPAAPAAKPVVTPVPAQAAVAPPAPNGEYQVPATSKYATQINAARAEQARRDAQMKAAEAAAASQPAPEKTQDKAPDKLAKKADKPTVAKPGEATAPQPSGQLADMETEYVFVPGETYKDEGDAPRLYSLHRMYGLQPDPIKSNPNATGAILEGADLNADEGPPEAGKKTETEKPDIAKKAKP